MVAHKESANDLKPYSHAPLHAASFVVNEDNKDDDGYNKGYAMDVPSREELAQRQHSYLSHMCVPQLVAIQASVTPDAIAVVAGKQQLSYKELNQKADWLARYLQQLGIQRNMLVGLCVERSLDMIVGLLGILKAGGAYVPLDPASPPDRLAFMLKDAGVSVLVTQQQILSRLSRLPASITTTVCLDSDSLYVIQAYENVTLPQVTVTTTDLAYMIYTSGSTGQPKGVPITHGSLMNLLSWHQHTFAVSSSDRATQLTSPAFDATGWELWPYLTLGASVYLPDEDTRVVPTLLRDWLLKHKITLTFLPTPLAESIMALEWPAITSLRVLLTGADTLHHYPPSTLPFVVVNNYGPTETTVVATSGVIPPTPHATTWPPIGKPIDNTHIYILDEQLRQVTGSAPGEIYIGGAGLATGYHNRPELTAERFIQHPFSNDPTARLYKTGDRAYWLPDGQIAFLGRSDYQIKIRGYRIEPDEIATVLDRHPAVQTSVIVAREDEPDDRHLVAYVVLVPTMQVSASSLRDALTAFLPSYMVPAIFVEVPTLPLMLNGKVDRTALPVPDVTNTIREDGLVAPTTPLEEWLAATIARLLKLPQVGLDENFFLLGGHSLLGAQIVMQVSAELDVNLSLLTLFSTPTVRQLASVIEQRLQARLDTMSYDEVQQLLQ
jgi:amino acid adenylation domain-containing protein